MAYKNLLNIACADKKEAFARYRDFMCKRNGTYDYSTTGIGWTLIDSSYAVDEDNPQLNDWYVMKSTGENGDLDLYVWVQWITNYMTVRVYQAWDITAHAGSTNASGNTNNYFLVDVMDTSMPIYCYGNLDLVVCVNAYDPAMYRATVFGYVQSIYEALGENVITITGAVSAGSDVSIDLGTIPPNWKAGYDVYLRTTHTNNNATVKMEKARIKSFSGTSIIVDLVYDYTANFKVCDSVGVVCSNNSQAFVALTCMITPTGTINQGVTVGYFTGLPLVYFDPEAFSDFFGIYILAFQTVYGQIGYSENLGYTPTHNAALAHLDVIVEPDGKAWRCFKIYNNVYMAVREV